ncbi:hypothetical protein [Geopseudomonas aromaticivorans]
MSSEEQSKPKFYGVKHLATTYCTTIPKVRKALMAGGVMTEDGLPTKPEYADARLTDDQLPWFAWRLDVADAALKAAGITLADEKQKATHIRSRYDAEKKLCNAVAVVGRLAGLDKRTEDEVLEKAFWIYSEAENLDPHFLGGPCSLLYIDRTKREATKLRKLFDERTSFYFDLAAQRITDEQRPEYKHQLEIIEAVFNWYMPKSRTAA